MAVRCGKWELSAAMALATLGLLLMGLHKEPTCKVVRGTGCWGILPTIMAAMSKFELLDLLHSFHEKEGSTWGTYYLSFGILGYIVSPLVVTRDPRNVEYMLKQNFGNFPKGREFHTKLEDLLGDGIFNSDGSQWSQQRKTSSQMFTAKRFKNHIWKVVQKNCQKMSDLLADSAAQGVISDLFNLLNRFTLDTIGEIGFGACIGSLENPKSPFLRSFDEAQRHAIRRFWVPGWEFEKFLDLGEEKKAKGHYKALREYSSTILVDLKANLESGAGDSFVGLFITEQPDLPQDFLSDLVLNFLIAGRDTTAQAMSWCLHLVMQHPEVSQRMRDEIKFVCGDQPLEYDQLSQLKYVDAVLRETLRLFPSVPIDSKQNLQADTLPDGTSLPRGCFLIYNAYSMGRCQAIWGKDARDFRPERWLGVEAVSPYSNPVFHAGPRECLGKRLAMVEMKAVLVTLLRHFKFDLAVPADTIRPDMALTIGMSSGLPCHVRVQSD